MTRRLHACLTCSGGTRHKDRRCSYCRKAGAVRLSFLPSVEAAAPSVRELREGLDLTPYLSVRQPLSYRGRGA